jgi:hypothetical protein
MNKASSEIVQEVCSGLSGFTFTQEEGDVIKEFIQKSVHTGMVRPDKTMEPYQERVVAEKNDLDEKIRKLTAFVGGTLFASLSDQERSRLSIQLQHMNGYSEILGQRIAAF